MNPWDEASFDWPLGFDVPDTVVVEVGGFEGRWLAGMAERYEATFHAFEPQPWAADRLEQRVLQQLGPNSALAVHRFGLGRTDSALPMRGWNTDACSFLKDDAWYERHPGEGRRDEGIGQIRPVGRVFAQLGLERTDVLMMNIEGFEYVLLPEMARGGLLHRIEHIAVQFHDGYDTEATEAEVRELIGRTHDVRWDWPGTLTAWTRRP